MVNETGDENERYYQNQQSYNENPYQWQPYSDSNYNLNGNPPLDKNGNPVKNRFGLKLTASILEIIGLNLVTFICGIIGCVYTTKANAAYQEERWDDFLSAKKASAVSLWIGFGVWLFNVLIVIIFGAIIFSSLMRYPDYLHDGTNTNFESYLENAEIQYENEADGMLEEEKPAREYVEGDGYTTPEITIDGMLITLPLSYTELAELGFTVEDEEYVINKNEYEYRELLNKDGYPIGYIDIINETDAPIACKDGIVFSITLYFDDWQEAVADFMLYNGVTQDTRPEELVEIFGSADYEYSSEDSDYDYQSFEWYMHHPDYYDDYYNSININYSEGKMNSLSISYIGWGEE